MTTKFSLALIRAGRALFGTVKYVAPDEAAFVMLATGTPVPVVEDDVFTSRGNVTNHAVSQKGSGLLTGSTMSLTGIALDERRIYGSLIEAIRWAAVGNDVPEDEKDRLIAAVQKYYGWDR